MSKRYEVQLEDLEDGKRLVVLPHLHTLYEAEGIAKHNEQYGYRTRIIEQTIRVTKTKIVKDWGPDENLAN
jgi:hypothetical protein